MGDARQTNQKVQNQHNIMDAFQRSGKRPRNELEEVTPTPSMSGLSSEGTDLSASASGASLPEIQVNSKHLESRDTIIETTRVDKEKLKLAFKIDNLKDKLGRYESHVMFLRKCLENNVIPNGLRAFVEPSIGNRDDEFLELWHGHLNDCSRKLINCTIDWSLKTIDKAKLEIKEHTDKLKTLVPAPTFKEIVVSLDKNDETRNNELVHRKNRKFYRLKYGEKERETPSNNRTNEILNNRGQRGLGRNEYTRERNNGNHERNDRHRDEGNRERNQRYSDAVTQRYSDRGDYEDRRPNQRYVNNQYRNQDQHNERVLEVIDRRTGNYQNNYAGADKEGGPRANLDLPIHERLLGRRNSRKNLRERTTESPREDFPPLRHERPREDQQQGKGTNDTTRDSRDREIEMLRKQIESMKQTRLGNDETITSHYTAETGTSPKNGEGAQQGPSNDNRTQTEMQAYIREAMRVICGFAEQLNPPTDSEKTHTDKL